MNAYNSNAERLFILDPQNEDHIRLLDEFQAENSIDLSSCLEKDEDPNSVNVCLFIEESSKMRDFCQIQGVKDLRKCNINVAHIETKRKRKLITNATDYALNTLGMQEVFVNISPKDEKLAMTMELDGYESIGEQDGNLVFLKENQDVLSQTDTYENHRQY